MFVIEISDETKSKRLKEININGNYFNIVSSNSFIQKELPKILNNLRDSLRSNDSKEVTVIFQKQNGLRVFLFKCLDSLFRTEFEQYCQYLCNYFYDELKWLEKSQLAIFKYILTNDLNFALDKKKQSGNNYIEHTNVPLKAIELFLNNRFNQIITAFKKDDIETIRSLFPPFGDGLRKKIYENDAYIDIFENFVRRVGKSLIEQERDDLANKTGLVHYIFTGLSSIQEYGASLLSFRKLKIIDEVVSEMYLSLAEKPNSYSLKDDIWKVREKKVQGFITRKLDFTFFAEEDKSYLKSYIHELVTQTGSNTSDVESRLHAIRKIYKYFKELPYNEITSLFQINYYHATHLLDYLQQLKGVNNEQLYSISTIQGFYIKVKLFIDWVIDTYNWEHDNAFSKIGFHNVKAFINSSTDYIPEAVIEKLENVLNETDDIVQNAWEIMMNTGVRFSDIKGLREDCIKFDEREGIYVLKFIIEKTEHQRIMGGKSKYHEIPASSLLIEAVRRQKELTADLRTIANTDRLFIIWNGVAVVPFDGRTLMYHINKLIKKHEIRDHNGEIYHYTNHQCRKTVIVDLLSQGLSLKKVADFIGHSEQVSARYYRDIEMKKIAEMDREMFKELFEETLEVEVKDQYTQAEKESLFREIQLGSRDTPEGHGTCVKHVSFGPCHKKKCVGCKLLITGPQKLPKWYQLYKEQDIFIKDLEQEYIKSGINNYKDHRSYQSETHLLGVYKDTIEKIEHFARKRGISIGQYKN